MIKMFFGSVFGFAGFLALIFGLSFLSYKSYEFFAPKYRAVDEKVFEQSEQYNQGMVRDLSELQRQYVTSDEAGKEALRPIIRQRFEVYPENKMPADLRTFYESIK
jgi:hypothetical protein